MRLDSSVRQEQCPVRVHLLADELLPADLLVQVTDAGRGHRATAEGGVVPAYPAVEGIVHPTRIIGYSRFCCRWCCCSVCTMLVSLLDVLECSLTHSDDVYVELDVVCILYCIALLGR